MIAIWPVSASGAQIRPPGSRAIWQIGAKPLPRRSVDQVTVWGTGVGADVANATGEGLALDASDGKGAAAIVRPSPPIAYTPPLCVPTKTLPLATVTQQFAYASMSTCQRSFPVAASTA